MIRYLLVIMGLTTTVLGAEEPIRIISQSQDISPDGSFFSKWESANGITFEEEGHLKNAGQKDLEAEEVRGSAGWTAPDGKKYNIGWIANENGAVFEGAHLPTPPPAPEIPIQIRRALEWIAAHPSKE